MVTRSTGLRGHATVLVLIKVLVPAGDGIDHPHVMLTSRAMSLCALLFD